MAMLNLAEALKARGHEIAVIFPDKKGPAIKKFVRIGITTYCNEKYTLTTTKHSKAIQKNRQQVLSYVRYAISEFHPDIVHTNVGPLDIAFEICRQEGIPHVWHLREYQDFDLKQTFYPSKEKFEELIHSKDNHNIAISQGIFDHWNLRISDRVIYNGVFSSQNIPTPNTAERPNKFFYLGRIQRIKSFGFMVRAYKKFIKNHPGYTLEVLGKVCDLYGLFWKVWSLVNLPKGSIKYHSKFHKVEIYETMNNSCAAIIPSKFETFGFICAGSMLSGCPVIGRNSGGVKEQLDNGLRIAGREIGLRFSTTQELCDRMELVASRKPELEAMKEVARKVVMENYSIERNAELVEAYYNEILSAK